MTTPTTYPDHIRRLVAESRRRQEARARLVAARLLILRGCPAPRGKVPPWALKACEEIDAAMRLLGIGAGPCSDGADIETAKGHFNPEGPRR